MLYQPTCVGLRYGRRRPSLEAFLGSSASIRAAWAMSPAPSHHLSVIVPNGFAYPGLPTGLEGLATPGPTPLRPPIAHNGSARDGNMNPLSIAYAFRPRLRPASPAVDQHGCGTLGHSVGRIRTPLALLMPTFALLAAPGRAPAPPSPLTRTLPYHVHSRTSAASVPMLEPRWIVGAAAHRPVSYYALFQGWLLLSQPPGCLCAATTLPT